VTPARLQAKVRVLGWAIYFQRLLRFGLRALWVATATYLSIWAVGSILALPVSTRLLSTAACTVGVLLFLPALFRVPHLRTVAWSMDRKLGLDEVLSSGLMVSAQARRDPLAGALIEDAHASLNYVARRVLTRGWYLHRELEGCLIVGILALAVFGIPSVQPLSFAAPESEPIMPLGQDPRAKEVFPSGLPGLSDPDPIVARSSADPDDTAQAEAISPEQVGPLLSALNGLGEDLSETAAASAVGSSLQRGDLEQAVKDLETLSDIIADVPSDARTAIASALSSAGDRLDPLGASALAEAMTEASDALASREQVDRGPRMVDVASELHELADAIASTLAPGSAGDTSEDASEGADLAAMGMAGGAGVGGATSVIRSNVPMPRLEGQGEAFQLGNDGAEPGGLVAGQVAESPSPSTIHGAFGAVSAGSQATSTTAVTPVQYLWEFANVVRAYFSRK